MNRRNQIINDSYEALMFAKTAEQARAAARDLIKLILGEDALQKPLQDALRECCRILRPSADTREQQRFEAEFVELAIWPTAARRMAA